MHQLRHRFLLPCVWAFAASAAGQDGPRLPEVRVIGTTPLPVGGLPRRQIPAAVQTLDADPNGSPDARSIADLLDQRLGSVQIQSIQGNPNQPDVSYRGFTASPVLGTPQGLSVYMDGVRMNQPFGDVVSWDLIPKVAIDSMTLMPGSNPLFGLNTLGGSLSLRTKDGIDWPGSAVQLSVGSYGRRALELEHGFAQPQGLDGYFAANLSHDDGWRDTSPSDVRQLFGKLGWQDARTRVTASLAYADNELWGNSVQDQQLLQSNWSSVYTTPDITNNRSTLLTFTGRHELDAANTLSGNLYWRNIRTGTINGDVNGDSLDQALYQPNAAERAALAAAGYTGFPTSGENASNTPFPFWRCLANVLLQDEPAEKCNGLINRGSTDQSQWGGSALLARRMQLAGYPNQLNAGLAFDASRVSYQQSTQLGFLNPDRSVTGLPAFADGVTGGTIDGEPFDNRVDLLGRTSTASIYASDTLTTGNWHWTAAGRYNHTRVRNTDQITPAGDPSSLTGDHTFARFNPALGVTYAPAAGWTAYGGYNEGTRAPSTIELACANPDQPCRLPNAMAGDPPLRQVVTRTWEFGLRGRLSSQFGWNASVFQRGQRRRHPVHRGAADRLRLLPERRPHPAPGRGAGAGRPGGPAHDRREPHVPAGHLPQRGDHSRLRQQQQQRRRRGHAGPGRDHRRAAGGSHPAGVAAGLQAQRGLAGLGQLVVRCDRACAGRLLCARQREQQPPAGWRVLPGAGSQRRVRRAQSLGALSPNAPHPVVRARRQRVRPPLLQRGAAWRDSLRCARPLRGPAFSRCRRRIPPAQQHLLRPGCTANFPCGLALHHRIAERACWNSILFVSISSVQFGIGSPRCCLASNTSDNAPWAGLPAHRREAARREASTVEMEGGADL